MAKYRTQRFIMKPKLDTHLETVGKFFLHEFRLLDFPLSCLEKAIKLLTITQ
jgi:hypothetical protein